MVHVYNCGTHNTGLVIESIDRVIVFQIKLCKYYKYLTYNNFHCLSQAILDKTRTTPSGNNNTPSSETATTPTREHEMILQRIVQVTNHVEQRMFYNVFTEQNKKEWIFVGMVLDRCFLIIFALVTGIVSFSILATSTKEIDINSRIV